MQKTNYFIGLDVGTDSVGYAASDDEYKLIKKKGESLWGATTFEGAKLKTERRAFRTARRRLKRRQNRVNLLQELFAPEILKQDNGFFLRIKESNLFREDKTNSQTTNVLFDDTSYKDADFYAEYPTIHHLIFELMSSDESHDIRMVYIACAWLVAHRGHFLNEVNKDNLEQLTEFEPIYEKFLNYFYENEYEKPWECATDEFCDILKKEISVTAKEKLFYELLFDGKKPKDTEEQGYPFKRALIIKLLSGGKVKPSELTFKNEYSELPSISLSMPEEEFAAVLNEMEEYSAFLLSVKAMFDWSILENILKGKTCISEAKIGIYNQHKDDLRNLKSFVREYCPEKYNEIFREVSEKNNYVAYTDHFDIKNVNNEKNIHKAKKEDFSEYLKKILKDIKCKEKDKKFYDDTMERLSLNAFLPKQVDGDNRVIPYQLYYYELKTLLNKAGRYHKFLNEKDADGLTVVDKVLSIFEFRIPYFVGPLSERNSSYAWLKRKEEGRIYPWNADKMIDMDLTEQEFIRRMTNTCSYLPSESVLPKHSLIYSNFEVLNTINNIKVNGQPVSVSIKQKIYTDLFECIKKVTVKKIKDLLKSEGVWNESDSLTGIDSEANVLPALKAYNEFRNLLQSKKLNENQVEQIIEHSTYSEDRLRYKKWIENKFADLKSEDKKYLLSLKYKNFGRLSKRLLCGINGVCKETGEVGTIMDFLWNTNDNFMQLLSDRYSFREEIEKDLQEYYGQRKMTVNETLDSMYVSNSVKRPILRALDIVDEVVSAVGKDPQKIFIEMARGASEKQKNKRTVSRKQQLQNLYAQIDSEDVRVLSKQLDALGDTADNQLQSDALFLYFTQLGKCMYSGKPLEISRLKQLVYNVDHIYPQSFVKDDSIINNKVLVLSEYNGEKSDKYPLPEDWRKKMQGFWYMLNKNGLISDEKYKRLVRSTLFTNEEKMNFINRQLTETQQSTKALASVLSQKYPETEIVYVKAGLVSGFRNEYDILKSRSVNDLHHAKDAYLNIVVGNVYNERFTKKWFRIDEKYSLKTKTLFNHKLDCGGKTIWNGEKSIKDIKKTMAKNNIHLTRYTFCRKGGLFDQMPVKAAEGLVPLKKGMDTTKYGGYNKTSATFFSLVSYHIGNKKELIIMPMELMYSQKFLEDSDFSLEYTKNTIRNITNKEVTDISFPLGKRILKINTVFSLNGFDVALGAKVSGGKQIGLIPLMSLVLPYEKEKYIKSLERFLEKKKKNSNIILNEEYDGITAERNIELYDLLTEKLSVKPYCNIPNCQYETLKNGRERFINCSVEEQVSLLLNIIYLFKSGRTGGVDLSPIGGSSNGGVATMSSNLRNWLKKYSDVRITDVSSSGIHRKQSCNLLDLL